MSEAHELSNILVSAILFILAVAYAIYYGVPAWRTWRTLSTNRLRKHVTAKVVVANMTRHILSFWFTCLTANAAILACRYGAEVLWQDHKLLLGCALVTGIAYRLSEMGYNHFRELKHEEELAIVQVVAE